MNRDAQFNFISTDTNEIINSLISRYEELTKVTVQPGSPEKLFILWVASVIVQERVKMNHIGTQNIPAQATGEYLDALGEMLYNCKRPEAQAAVCTVRFHITQALPINLLIPAGTRVADSNRDTVWHTQVDTYIESGQTSTDIQVICEKVGAAGNGYAIGQINSIVDLYDYYSHCENITESDAGADAATDDEYYELMRQSIDGFSCAGPSGAYEYFAKQVSTEISDVIAVSPNPCVVEIFVVMNDGQPALEEIKNAVKTACSAEWVRPMCDKVSVKDPNVVNFDVDFTYYIKKDASLSATEIADKVKNAVDKYVHWQCSKMGRDIVPDRLREYLSGLGIKRIELTAPEYSVLEDGRNGSTPELAQIGSINIRDGGYEDE